MGIIRKIRMTDVEACHRIVKENWNEDAAARFLSEITLALDERANYKPTYFVYTKKGKVIGFAGMIDSLIWPDVWDFVWINVDKQHQGEGIGKKLTKHRIREVEKAKGAAIHLLTKKPGFFEKLGFGEIHHYHWGDVHLMSMHLRELKL